MRAYLTNSNAISIYLIIKIAHLRYYVSFIIHCKWIFVYILNKPDALDIMIITHWSHFRFYNENQYLISH